VRVRLPTSAARPRRVFALALAGGLAALLAAWPGPLAAQPAPSADPSAADPSGGRGPRKAPLRAPAAEEDPRVAFRVAENTFRYQDYDRAAGLLENLLYPEVRLVEAEELLAREYLGASYWWLQSFERAEEEFTVLLTRDPDRQLDAFYYPAALITFFEGVRETLVRLKVIPDNGGPDGPDDPRAVSVVAQERVIRERSLLVAFLPFGIGQFQNGHTTKGIVFLTVETLALATNIASYFVIEALREDNGFIAPQNIDRAEAFEIVLYTSLGVFAAVAVGGIVDALVCFEPRDETVRPLELPPPGAPETTLRLLPSVGVERFGLDLELRF
jgi:tetratricopeptide (TPR) repeat protein